MIDLNTLPNTELVEIFNKLSDKPIKSWKGKKSELISRIVALQPATDTIKQAFEKVSAAPEPTTTPPTAVEKPAEVVQDNKPSRTIRATAIELLCSTAFYEDKNVKSGPTNIVEVAFPFVQVDNPNARSVGIPYDQIIDSIKEAFPDCQTTVACLRWYSVKIRVEELGYEDLRLPQRRPRAKPRLAA